ncbi:hypothetical protein ACFQ0B_14570 [Nonomuraea thailandensis]
MPYSRRYREGLSKILLVDRATGAGTYVDPAPHRSLQTRGDDGPVWSPDGSMLAFAMESLIWVLPVDGAGRPTGRARQVTREVSDAPVWAGDSATLLYLNGGRLRSVRVAGGSARTVPHRLTWRNDPGPEQVVVHAGRMWDGVSATVARDVDIIVRGQRITAVEPHRDGRPGTLVDASDRFVMPGLIDIHHHREMQGYAYGSRQGPLWLALGITTTRSPGSPRTTWSRSGSRCSRAPGSRRVTWAPARPSTGRASTTTSCGRRSPMTSCGWSWSGRPTSTTT